MSKYLKTIPLLAFFLIAFSQLSPGFYSDDWSTIIAPLYHGAAWSGERLIWCLQIFASRPVSGGILYILSSINGDYIFGWRLSVFLLSLLLVLTLKNFLQIFHYKNKFSLIFALLIIIFPWNIGSTAFVTAAISVILSTIFFLFGMLFLFKYLTQKKSLWFLISSCLLYLISCLTYEAYYFQYIVIFLLALMVNRKNGKLIGAFISFTAVFLLAILLNRYLSATFVTGPVKNFSPNFLITFIKYSFLWPGVIISSFKDLLWLFIPVTTLFSVAISLVLLKVKNRGELKKIFLFELIVLFGILLSIFTYALAGYEFVGRGTQTRANMVLSLYLILGVYVFYSRVKYTNLLKIVSIGVVVVLIIGYFWRLQDWVVSWSIQQKILNQVPINQIYSLPQDSVVLYKGPQNINGVTVFEASWEIGGAIDYKYNHLNSCFFNKENCLFRQYGVLRFDWSTLWNGTTIVQYDKGKNMISSIPAKIIYLWDYDKNTFTKINSSVSLK